MIDPSPAIELHATIRPMIESDLPAALALWASAEGVELAEGDSEAELCAYLSRNPGTSHVAVNARGEVIGAILAGHDGRRGFVYHLAVSPAVRGRGIGHTLVERCLAVLRSHRIRRVLALVSRDNERGRTFWLSNGWEALDFATAIGIDL